ncbi:MAG: hypothetical protein NVS9B1_12090 [Candidatus Dormibacteraceae bacterium]
MAEHLLIESVPNFSEGRSAGVAGAIAAAAGRTSHVLDLSLDPDHHRSVLTMAGAAPGVMEGAFAAIAAAVEKIDIRAHAGVHPRRGAADVVPIVPLTGVESGLAACIPLAHALGERVWAELRVPVHFYGAAGSHTLSALRSPTPPPPDLGEPAGHPTGGFCAVGVRGPLIAYNVVLEGGDIALAAALARSLRESSGGLIGVQALAFTVAAGPQLSMNLVRPGLAPPALVLAEARRRLAALGGAEGARLGADEVVGLCPATAAVGCTAATGKLLECRLAAAACRAAAAVCRARPGEEMRLLAGRLTAEAESQAALGPDDLLTAAERAEAVRRVLVAGRVADGDLDSMLRLAAEGLRAALPEAEAEAHPARVAALDRWLSE